MRMDIMIKTPPPPPIGPHAFPAHRWRPAVVAAAARAPGFVIKSLWHRCALAHHHALIQSQRPLAFTEYQQTPGFLDGRRNCRDTRARLVCVRVHTPCSTAHKGETPRRSLAVRLKIPLLFRNKKEKPLERGGLLYVTQTTAAANPARGPLLSTTTHPPYSRQKCRI